MADDREKVRQALDFQARAREHRILDIPGYMEWSKRRLREGTSPASIAHLDAFSVVLLPEDLATIGEDYFEEMLEEIESGYNHER